MVSATTSPQEGFDAPSDLWLTENPPSTAKYCQPPVINPQIPVAIGLDEPSIRESTQIVADDWRVTTAVRLRRALVGSHLGWEGQIHRLSNRRPSIYVSGPMCRPVQCPSAIRQVLKEWWVSINNPVLKVTYAGCDYYPDTIMTPASVMTYRYPGRSGSIRIRLPITSTGSVLKPSIQRNHY